MAADNTLCYLKSNTANAQHSLEKLSSGLRINKAADDAAGLAISEKMKAQINGLGAAQNNVKTGVSLVQTADGELGEVQSIIQRLNEIAVEAKNGVLTDPDKDRLQSEADEILTQLDATSSNSQFNETHVFNEEEKNGLFSLDGVAIQVGAEAGQTMSLNLNNLVPAEWVGARCTNPKPPLDLLVDPKGAARLVGDSFKVDGSGPKNFPTTEMTIYNDYSQAPNADADVTNGTITISGEKYQVTDLKFQKAEKDASGNYIRDGAGNIEYGSPEDINNQTLTQEGGNISNNLNDPSHRNDYLFSFGLTNDGFASSSGAPEPAKSINYSGKSTLFQITTYSSSYSHQPLDPLTYGLSLSSGGSSLPVHVSDSTITEYSPADASTMQENSNGDYVKDSATGKYVLYSDVQPCLDTGGPAPTRYTQTPSALNSSAAKTLLPDSYKLVLACGGSDQTVHFSASQVTEMTPSSDAKMYEDANGDYVKDSGTGKYVLYNDVQSSLKAGDQPLTRYNREFVSGRMDLQGNSSVGFNADYDQDVTIGIHSFTAHVAVSEGKCPNANMNSDTLNTDFSLTDEHGNEVGLPHYTYIGDKRAYNYDSPEQYAASPVPNPDGQNPEGGGIRYSGTSYHMSEAEVRPELDVTNMAGMDITGKILFVPPVYLAVNKMATLTAAMGANDLYVSGMDATSLGLGFYDGTGTVKLDITGENSLGMISHALNTVSIFRSRLGSDQNRLNFINDNLTNEVENLSSAESTLTDADMGKEMMTYTKNSILMQASQAMLAQANNLTDGVLSMLK